MTEPVCLHKKSKWLLLTACCYLLLVVALYFFMSYAGDRWWPATILLFSPRWLFALPLVLLLPFVLWLDRRALIPLALAGLVVVIPLMGFNLPFGKPGSTRYDHVIRVLTYNIHEGDFNAERFSVLLKDSAVDLVALQECPEELQIPLPRGWQSVKKRGLAVLSRYPIRSVTPVEVLQPKEQWPGTYLLQTVIQAPGGDVAFCSLHLPSPRFGLQAVLDKATLVRPSRRKLLEQQTVARYFVAKELKKSVDGLKLPVIVVGDFNTPVESALIKQFWGNYKNAFSETAWGYGATQRVSVRGFHFSSRIDHVLTGSGLKPLLCVVGPDLGSDHLPLIADIGWVTGR